MKNIPVMTPCSSVEEEDPDATWDKEAVPALSSESIHCSSSARVCSSSMGPGQSPREVEHICGRTVFVARKVVVEVFSGSVCVELSADARDILFGEPRSCETVESSQRFDLGRL